MHEAGAQGARDYIYLDCDPIALVKNGVLYIFHNVHPGRPEAVANSTGSAVWSIEVNAWGSDQPIGSLNNSSVRFPGQYFEQESGNYYDYFRTYDSSTGRYLESVPLGLPGGLNTYAYDAGSPLVYTDPYGLQDAAAAAMSPAVISGTRIYARGVCAIPFPEARVVGGLIFAATFPTGDTPIDDDSSYPGKSVVLRDGTQVGTRPTSQSAGATIDIRFPNGSTAKVHITGG